MWTKNFCSVFAPKVAFSNLSGIVWTRPKPNASPVANSGNGPIHLSVQVPVTSEAEACPAVPPLLSSSRDGLNRLESDECSNIVVNLCSSSGLQERDLLEYSYADYLDGSYSVIAKGRLRVNISFWVSIGACQFILSVIRDGYKILFYYTPTSVLLKKITRRSMSVHWVACGTCYSKSEGTELGGIELHRSRQFQVRAH